MIPLQLLLFVVGLVILYFGAEWLVKGAASLAIQYGIRPLIVGITIVALATSMPELLVNFLAALTGEDSLALGTIVGSNICNIALILGISSLVYPLSVAPNTLKREYTIMLVVMVAFYLLSLDGTISHIDGILLILGLMAFLFYLVRDSRRQPEPHPSAEVPTEPNAPTEKWKRVAIIILGMIGLTGGARLMVYSAVNIAEFMGISPIVVGLTVVAIGTSLPELAASVACVLRKGSRHVSRKRTGKQFAQCAVCCRGCCIV